MAPGKKQPDMFEAFRRAKGDKPEEQKPPAQTTPPPAKPVTVRPTLPTATRTTPPAEKPVAPKPAEVKAPVPPKPVDVKPAETAAGETKPVAPKPVDARPAAATAVASPVPVTKPAVPVASRPAALGTASRPAGGAGDLQKLGNDDVHVVALGKKPEVIFGVSYHALIVGIIVVVVAAVLVFLVALAIGRHGKPTVTKATDKSLGVVDGSGKTGPGKGEGGTTQNANPLPAGTYYCVQVYSTRNKPESMKPLEDDMAFLKTMRVGLVFSRPNSRGDFLGLFVGAFAKDQKTLAEDLAKRVREMRPPKTGSSFKGAQVVAVSQ